MLTIQSKATNLKEKVNSLVNLRRQAIDHIEPLIKEITGDQFPRESVISDAIQVLSDLSVEQKDLLEYLSINYEHKLVNLNDVNILMEEIEKNEKIKGAIEQIKISIFQFIKLECIDQDIIEEIKQQQASAKELLESYSSDEKLTQLGEKYDLAMKIALRTITPEASDYSRITKEIGFATSYALKKGLFKMHDIEIIEIKTDNFTLTDISETDVQRNDIISDQTIASMTSYKVGGKKLQKFSVSKFEQDLKKISSSRGSTELLLTYIYNHGILSENELYLFNTADTYASDMDNNLEYSRRILRGLCQKGYLASWEITKEEEVTIFYTLSSVGAEAFQKETSRKQLLQYSKFKPSFKTPGDDYLLLDQFEEIYEVAHQLSLINQAQILLEKSLKSRFLLENWKTLSPMPHRDLEYRKLGIRLVIVAPLSEDNNYNLNLIKQIIDMKKDCVPIIWTSSVADGRYLSKELSEESHTVYFLTNEEEKVLLSDSEGEDKFQIVFEQNVENEKANVEIKLFNSDINNGANFDNLQHNDAVENIHQPLPERISVSTGMSEEFELNKELQKSEESLPELTPYIEKEDLNMVVEKSLMMLSNSKLAEAMILLHSVADYSVEEKILRDKISFSLDDPLCKYDDLFTLVDTPLNLSVKNQEILNDYLNVAMWLRIFFNPDNPNDHRLKSRWNQINSDNSSLVLQSYPSLKKLIGHFWLFLERHKVGFKFCTSGTVRDQMNVTKTLEQIKIQLDEVINVFNTRNIKATIGHKKAYQMVLELYGNNGVITNIVKEAYRIDMNDFKKICSQFVSEDMLTINHNMGGITPEDKKLENFIDKYWSEMDFKSNFDKNVNLLGREREHQRSWLRDAVTPVLNCYIYRLEAEKQRNIDVVSPEAIIKYRTKASEIMFEVLNDLLQDNIDIEKESGHTCLTTVITQLHKELNEEISEEAHFYENLLLTGEIEIDEQYLPVLDNWMHELPNVKEFRLWERAVKHCDYQEYTWQEAAEGALFDYDMGRYNLIFHRFNKEITVDELMVVNIRKKVQSQIIRYKEEFMTSVEVAQNYGQISSKAIMDNYFKLAIVAEQHAIKLNNSGFYNRLLEACRKQILQDSKERLEATQVRLQELKENILNTTESELDEDMDNEKIFKRWPILEKINQMLDKRNMTVAEDYIQLANNGKGQRDIPSIQQSISDPFNLFFQRYQAYFTACNSNKSSDLNRIYEREVKSSIFANQRNRNTTNADEFIRQWSKLTSVGSLESIVKHLSFHEIAKVRHGNDNELFLYPKAIDGTLGQYSHPFTAFGTQTSQKGMRVIHMAGTRSAENILDELVQYGASGAASTIVLLDYALPLGQRKILAKSVKLRGIPEIIIVIDRVMALFLAGYSQVERGNVMLQIALPFSNIQPYIPNGIIPPEMFIGRTDELNRIRNLNGPVLVYGGRQLGKTALLRQAKNLDHHPEKGSYAIFIDLKQDNCHTAPKKISEELVYSQVLDKECATWDELKVALKNRLNNGERPIHKLLLLLDEADRFLSSCEQEENRPLEILKEIKDSFNDQFKFVLAGLRDVVRFNKRRLNGNSVLAHMGHITIRPLAYADACDLLQKPLHYLGFRIDEKDEHMLSLILAKTNYYPGLIHFYCQKLIEATIDSYKNGSYSESTSPPYLLDEKHLKTLLSQSEFLEMIEDRFRITLQLDKDDLYDILANAMAYHYYTKGVNNAATVGDIMNVCEYFEIKKICRMTENSLKALLEEMDELNIFRQEQGPHGKYIFNRYSFFQMLGSSENVFDQLLKYSEQGA
ncbi:AAA family ATPase [Paenibacillus xylanexedens]|uniref:AAA family ATPase n=1 Tax=Paenibacillus xylanexedens TaxID=528191 RepID=UPI0011A8E076|nr:ATP-binding protein [Paenibacillus xylanexedens]